MTAKTVITKGEIPFNTPIEYTFQKDETRIKILAKNTSEARRILYRGTRGEKGYKLIQRLL